MPGGAVKANSAGGTDQARAKAEALRLLTRVGIPDPAGALIDASTFAKMKALALAPQAYLDNNDATTFFEATGDLLLPGPTLTNVNDIRVILVD